MARAAAQEWSSGGVGWVGRNNIAKDLNTKQNPRQKNFTPTNLNISKTDTLACDGWV